MRHRTLAVLVAAFVLVFGLVIQQGDVGAASLASQIELRVKADLTETAGLAPASAPLILQRNLTLANGTGAGQANKVWSDRRTLTASSSENHDLAGGTLKDAFGVAFEPAKVRLLVVTADGANTNDVVLLGDTNSVLFLSTAATTVAIPPGGFIALATPNLAGVAVVADTGDIVKVANGGAGTSVTYEIIILGTSS